MPNKRRADWTSRGVAMPDELWFALQSLAARMSREVGTKISVGGVVRLACVAYDRLVADPFDEDGYCRWCGNGKWKAGHDYDCQWADLHDPACQVLADRHKEKP